MGVVWAILLLWLGEKVDAMWKKQSQSLCRVIVLFDRNTYFPSVGFLGHWHWCSEYHEKVDRTYIYLAHYAVERSCSWAHIWSFLVTSRNFYCYLGKKGNWSKHEPHMTFWRQEVLNRWVIIHWNKKAIYVHKIRIFICKTWSSARIVPVFRLCWIVCYLGKWCEIQCESFVFLWLWFHQFMV